MARSVRTTLCTALCLAASLSAQVIHVVDASGNSGKFKTINAALAVAKDGDSIYVKKGYYAEYVDLVGKAVNILGIAPKVTDVRIAGPNLGWRRDLMRIERHPAGKVTRIARVMVNGVTNTNAVVVTNSKGKLVFDQVETGRVWVLESHQGTIAMSNVKARTGLTMLAATSVENLFLHGCWFDSTFANGGPKTAAAVRLEKCHAEIADCRILGPDCHILLPRDGGPAIELIDAQVRVTGHRTRIGGGSGRTSTPTFAGGPAVQLSNSKLVWSGPVFGYSYGTPRTQLFVTKKTSTITEQKPAAPVIEMPTSFARNQITRTTLHASPNALSLSYLSLEFTPFRTPLGTFVVDPAKSIPIGIFKHDAKGKRSFDLDLRGLPASFVSSPFVLQTFAVDTNANLAVSAPRMGVVGY